jgi:alanyl-tRNA synthetase
MPTDEQIAEIEAKVNEVIAQNLPVFSELMTRDDAKAKFNLERLPEDASETLKIVHVGDYDACPCIGAHVENTSEIGQFKILTSNYENGIWRVRWKITNN